MSNLDRRSAWILLAVLALVAVIGLEQGVIHGLAAVRTDAAAQTADQAEREPVPRAVPLSTPSLDEPTVRRIAREEAEAAIVRSRPKKAAPAPDTTPDDAASDAAAPPPQASPPSSTPAAPTG